MKYIELHIHLDGSIRLSTLYELACKKYNYIPKHYPQETFAKTVSISGKKSFDSLTECLKVFNNITSLISGDKDILERIAYEFVEDQYTNNILYTEVRYNPHILQGNLPLTQVVHCINKGIEKGCKKFGIHVNSILCCLRDHPEWSMDIVNLATDYKNKGVVGIDLAGDELRYPDSLHIGAFQVAHRRGINITVHAGEVGEPESIKSAIKNLYAKRIGHGYAAIKDKQTLDYIKNNNIHMECCPTSSLQTCSVEDIEAINTFAKEKINYSINSDDPSVFEVSYQDEIDFVKNTAKLDDKEIKRIIINSLDSAFISNDKKYKILKLISSESA